MIQFILLALSYAGLAYLGVGFIGLAFLSLREKKYSWETIKKESGDSGRKGPFVQR